MAPLAPSYKTPSKIRDVPKTAHRELQRRGFLAGVSYEKRNGVPWVRYRIEPEFDRLRSLSAAGEGLVLGAEPTEDERRAIVLLAKEGVWANVARDLVRRHDPEECCRYVESLLLQKGGCLKEVLVGRTPRTWRSPRHTVGPERAPLLCRMVEVRSPGRAPRDRVCTAAYRLCRRPTRP